MPPILITENYWRNSHLSIVRHYGSVNFCENEFTIVDKEGLTVFEASAKAEKEGRQMAIEPGEPCDLVRNDFIPFYKKLGRQKFLEILQDNLQTTESKLKKIYKEAINKRHEKRD